MENYGIVVPMNVRCEGKLSCITETLSVMTRLEYFMVGFEPRKKNQFTHKTVILIMLFRLLFEVLQYQLYHYRIVELDLFC